MRTTRLGPEMRLLGQGEGSKILTMAVLLVICCTLTYYFHAILGMGTVFTHFFYVPVILAALWWGRAGLVVAIFLAVLLISSSILFRAEVVTANDYLRAILFIVIAFVVATLREMLAKAQDKTAHSNAVLRAIRNVNQLIVKEGDRDRMIKSACAHLIETRGYHSAWIALVDGDRNFLAAAEAGLGERFDPVLEMLKRGEFAWCGHEVLEQPGVVVVESIVSDCSDCPLAHTRSDSAGMVVRLEYGERVYGMLSVSIPDEMASDADEQSLFSEVADDIAFSLHRMELEEENRKAEAELERHRNRLEWMVEARTAELNAASEQMKQEIAERRNAEALIEHLNSVLSAIRNVNQLIVAEKDRDALLQKSCDALIEARGYDAAWIGLLQDGEDFVTVKGSGFTENAPRFCREMMSRARPPCVGDALAHQSGMFLIVDKSTKCVDCPSKSACVGKKVAVIRLEHAGKIFGLLVISLVAEVTAEEKDLLKEVASDIALGLHDIEMEKAHRIVEERLRDFVERIPLGISINTVEGVTVDANPAALEIFGYDSKEEFLKVPASFHYCYPEDRERFVKLFEKGSIKDFEARFKRRDGTVLWLSLASVIRIAEAGETWFVNAFQDITERKLAEKRIKEESRRAEFYSDLMGHDINNLSQVTSGHLELLLMTPDLSSKLIKHAETALDHVRKSAGIISSVKTLSKVRSGKFEIEKIDIYPAFASAVETAKLQSEDVRISSNITEGRYFIRGNALLFDVFSNLLNNAVKFDGHDIVEIDVDISSSGDNWEIRFMDRGRGIRHDYKKIIFNRLERAGESAQGSGLGLTIVKYVVLSYGGKVWVEDRVKGDLTQGSKFIVLIPKGG